MQTCDEPVALYEQFVIDYRTSLRHTAVSFTGDWHAAEDLVQEALFIMHRRWHDIEPAARVTYARTVLSHLAARWYAVSSRCEVPHDDMPELLAPSRLDGQEVADRLLVRDIVGGLPQRQRNVVYLRYWHRMSTAEIARLLGIPLGTVRSDLTRSAARLRRAFWTTGGAGEGRT